MASCDAATLGQRLRARRHFLGLQAKEVAKLLSVDPKTLMWWERDGHEPAVGHFPALIAFLGEEPWEKPLGLPGQVSPGQSPFSLHLVARGGDPRSTLRW